jgi:hypothetical protein
MRPADGAGLLDRAWFFLVFGVGSCLTVLGVCARAASIVRRFFVGASSASAFCGREHGPMRRYNNTPALAFQN